MTLFVLVTGPPGSGKSTLARPLAGRLQLPLMAKDPIKEALMDVLGWPTSVAQSRALGRAAVKALLATAATSGGAVLDSTFPEYAFPWITALPGSVVEVQCRCPPAVARERYRARARAGTRHAGHLDLDRQPAELWNDESLQPLGLGPVLVVDTETPVDAAVTAADVVRLAETADPRPPGSPGP